MKPYATYIDVNGDKAYFKDDILEITSTNRNQLYAFYQDGSTSKCGVTVQEVKEAILKNMKIAFNQMETGVGGAPDRLISKYFITRIADTSSKEIEEYTLYYRDEYNNDCEIIVNFGQEPTPYR
jgi:hypothetical protein